MMPNRDPEKDPEKQGRGLLDPQNGKRRRIFYDVRQPRPLSEGESGCDAALMGVVVSTVVVLVVQFAIWGFLLGGPGVVDGVCFVPCSFFPCF